MGKRDSRFNNLFINKDGFTLIELLTGISILMLIITALYTTLIQGISLMKRNEEKITLYYEIRLSLDQMATALRNTINLGKEKFEGTSISLTFITLDPQLQALSRITYHKDKNRLLKKKRTLMWEENKDLEEIMIEGVSKVDFKYLDLENTWHDSWHTTHPPKAVKLGLEVDKEIFTTIVWLHKRN